MITRLSREWKTRRRYYDSDVGIDAKFGVTPSLNLDVTYNTDFAQVEVDEQQINLTRFNLFFPEKRQFFLENAGTFAFGKSGVNLFFSRRIGIDTDTGAPVPIVGGGLASPERPEGSTSVCSRWKPTTSLVKAPLT